MTESISYQNAFARAKQRENAGRTRAPDNASLTAHDRTLPNAKMELMLPCRKVPIQGTRRMGNPVPTASSGGQSQESQAPENDHSTQFREQSKAKDPDDGAGTMTPSGMATKVPVGNPTPKVTVLSVLWPVFFGNCPSILGLSTGRPPPTRLFGTSRRGLTAIHTISNELAIAY